MAFPRIPNTPAPLGSDPWLAPWLPVLKKRRSRAEETEQCIGGLQAASRRHEFFGLHKLPDGSRIFREWLPHAEKVFLTGDFSRWQDLPRYQLHAAGNGCWEIKIAPAVLTHGMHYAMHVYWPGGNGLRLPACCRCVEQDPGTLLFSAVVWDPPDAYQFRYAPPAAAAPLIYEAHIGMAQEEAKVGTFEEFRKNILPRIAQEGYNVVQLMGIPNHPYYGSFGYHVANFFAVSCRFGTPDDFKRLVDNAHKLGLRVIIDIVHSHAVKNEAEGLARIDGARDTYFRGEHPGWDSLCFDYGKKEVLRFLLSNCRFFLEEYRIDGFRFDGVTSMLYFHHGLNHCFSGYEEYFGPEADENALAYLTLANKLIHTVRPDALTIAEDVSGMPGLASPAAQGGIGFDFRMAMGVTDMWFKLLDLPDETWNMFYLHHELTNRRSDERSVSYVECHDQSIVGGKTAMFRMADAAMYDSMHVDSQNPAIDRAIALHKMMRLATAAAAGNGYLNFMGNEFGHPEWVDLPRAGNNWSCGKARRQWSLAEDPHLRFRYLLAFDRAMLQLVSQKDFYEARVQTVRIDDEKKIIILERGGYWFFFNFHPQNSFFGHPLPALPGRYRTVLDSDDREFGGFSRRTPGQTYFVPAGKERLELYLPCRTALVLQRDFPAAANA